MDADYALGLQVWKGNHNGTYNILIDGKTVATAIDTYSATGHLEYLNLGSVPLTAGTHTLTITTANNNPNSINAYEQGINDNGNALGLDYIRLIPKPPARR